MATSREYLAFVLDQLSGVEGVTHRQMMGEYILYCRGRIFAYLCDDRLLLKPTPAALALLSDAAWEAPYEGAKPMLLADCVDDRAFLAKLVEAMYPELPEPKKKGSRK